MRSKVFGVCVVFVFVIVSQPGRGRSGEKREEEEEEEQEKKEEDGGVRK